MIAFRLKTEGDDWDVPSGITFCLWMFCELRPRYRSNATKWETEYLKQLLNTETVSFEFEPIDKILSFYGRNNYFSYTGNWL